MLIHCPRNRREATIASACGTSPALEPHIRLGPALQTMLLQGGLVCHRNEKSMHDLERILQILGRHFDRQELTKDCWFKLLCWSSIINECLEGNRWSFKETVHDVLTTTNNWLPFSYILTSEMTFNLSSNIPTIDFAICPFIPFVQDNLFAL